jgi:hypothetical protein
MDKKIEVFSGEQHDEDWPPDTGAHAFLAWFQRKLLHVPQEFWASAIIEIGGADGYGTIKIYYRRPETDEEAATRAAKRQHRLKVAEDEERKTFERLARKYATSGGKPAVVLARLEELLQGDSDETT